MNVPRVRPDFDRTARLTPVSGLRARIALLTAFVAISYTTAQVGHAQGVDATTAVHFLEQASFGPTALDVVSVQSMGPAAWIDQQMTLPESPLPDGLNGDAVRSQLFLNMATGPDQLRQRVMFALSQTIVVSANKVTRGEELTPWVRLLSQNAFGNFRTVLQQVSLSPTMGKYLDNVYNRKATATTSPNENYARELLQLFSIGTWDLNTDGSQKLDGGGNPIPSYTQATIGNFARALTGWTYPPMPGATSGNSNPEYFVGNLVPTSTASRHDTDPKTLLNGLVTPAGLTAAQDLQLLLDNIFLHPNVAPFIATRLIRSMVTSNPSPAYVARVSNTFVNNGAGVRGDLAAVVRAVLLDPEALNPTMVEHGRLKDPVLHVIGFGRALGATISDPNSFQYVFSNLSQRVLTPATVFSFYQPTAMIPGQTTYFGPEFQLYPPALAIQRANFIYGIITGQFGSAYAIDRAPFQAAAGNPTALVDMVNQRLMMGRMSSQLKQVIVTATTAVPASDVSQRAIGALYLAAISSEYTVYGGGFSAGGVIPTNVQSPTGLTVAYINGNMLTLRWTPPTLGPAATSYLLEGGISPGAPFATLPTGSPAAQFTFAAPSGSFYIRLRAVSGGQVSLPSNEVRVYVNIPQRPSPPTNFQAAVKATWLWLAWRNTYAGGAPTGLAMDVTGGVTATIPLPFGESFSVPGMPRGTFTLRLRALNAAGASNQSSSVTVTSPSTNCAAPRVPSNYFATRVGNTVVMSWEPPSGGTPAHGYHLTVTGSISGVFPVTGLGFAAAAPPGTYNLSVRAVSACGSGPATAFQTVVIP
jgi:uncharacterized protein (DUF1800 family)